jgi:hypothetical protein
LDYGGLAILSYLCYIISQEYARKGGSLKKQRKPRKDLYKFHVQGPVPGFKDEIDEWTSAANAGQGLLQIQRSLEKQFRVPVYLGNCTVTQNGRKR